MNPPSRSAQILVWGGLVLLMVVLLTGFLLQLRRRASDGAPGVGAGLSVLFPVPDFALTNQAGRVIGLADLRGQVWLADIIFTRCAGPCPEMTRRMAELQNAIPSDRPVRFITLTTDPEHDTPAVLETWSRQFQPQAGRWHFLTGTKRQIADLAVGGLKLTALDKEAGQQDNPNDLFIHSTMFVLVDRRGRARAVFESDDAQMKPKVLAAVAALAQER